MYNFKELSFTPNNEHYRMLELVIFLLKDSLKSYKIYVPFIELWINHLEKDGLKALNYMVEVFDYEAQPSIKIYLYARGQTFERILKII